MTKSFNTRSPVDMAVLTALKLALTCLLRVSEYLPGRKGVNHWLRSEDVAFTL